MVHCHILPLRLRGNDDIHDGAQLTSIGHVDLVTLNSNTNFRRVVFIRKFMECAVRVGCYLTR